MASNWSNNTIQPARFGHFKGYLTTATMLADANATCNAQPWPYDLTGQWLISVSTLNGSTGMTDNINLTITETTVNGYDMLGGTGNNAIKNNGGVTIRPGNNNAYLPVPIYGPLIVKMNVNNVANASTVITIRTVPMP